jgi:hypothetical protein
MAYLDNQYTNSSKNSLLYAIHLALPPVVVPPIPPTYTNTSENVLLWNILHQIEANAGGGGGGGTAGWALTGNNPVAGNFLGTTTDEKLEIRTGANGGISRLLIGDDGSSSNVTMVQISEQFGILSFGNPIPTSNPCAICSQDSLEIISASGLNLLTPENIAISAGDYININAVTDLNLSANKITLSVSNIPGDSGVCMIGLKDAPSGELELLGRDASNGEVKTFNDIPFVKAGNAWELTGNDGDNTGTIPMVFGSNTVNDIILKTSGLQMGVLSKTGKLGIGLNTPESKLHVNGSFGVGIADVFLDYLPAFSMQNTDTHTFTFIGDRSPNNYNTVVTFPLPASCPGRIIIVRREDDTSTAIPVFNGDIQADNFGGTGTFNLVKKMTRTYQSNGFKWMLINIFST